jgi:hypothetical protein
VSFWYNENFPPITQSISIIIFIYIILEADPKWSCGTDEFEFQHLLTKRYVSPQLLIDWQCGRTKFPPSLAHLGGNRSGLLLMQLRAKLTSSSTHRLRLYSIFISYLNHLFFFAESH